MTKTKTPPPPSALHLYEPPTEIASQPPSQRHHHDHEHHHHYSHYVRSVKPSGTVKETIEEKRLDGFKGEGTVEAQAKVVSGPSVRPIASAKASSKTKSTSIAASVKTPSAAVATSHITRRKSILATRSAPAQVVEVVPAATSAPATIVPSVVPSVATLPTIIQRVQASSKAPSAKAISGPRTVKERSLRAPLPTPSHRSRYSHHHPEVIVNVTIPQAIAASAVPLPLPVITPDPPTPIVTEETAKETVEKAVEDVPATPLAVPATAHHASKTVSIPAVPPSLSPFTRSRLSRLQSAKATTVPLPPVAPTAVEQGVDEEPEEKVVEETRVTTTTRTIKRQPASPPKVFESSSRYLENTLEDEDPAPPPSPPPSTKPKSSVQSNPQIPPLPPSPVCSAPNTTVTMKCHLFKSKSSPSPNVRTVETTTVETISYPLLPQQSIEETDVNTAATTAGGPTTKGIGGARSVALTASSGRMSGTRAGIRPIPMGMCPFFLFPSFFFFLFPSVAFAKRKRVRTGVTDNKGCT